MDCRQARALLNAAIDNELDLVTQVELDEHLSACAGCAGLRDAAARLRASVAAAQLYYRPPAHLERKVRAAIRENARPGWGARLAETLRALAVHRLGLAAGAAAVVLALAVGFGLGQRRAAPVVTDEIVDAHIRSLLPGHLTDIPSSEHHTVKPWFAGRLDFSPAVPDLSAAGFVLSGARIDYVAGRPVAALVYHRRQHVINVFAWPATERGGGAVSLEGSRRGYNVVSAVDGPTEVCAVSDLNAAELREFVRLFLAAK